MKGQIAWIILILIIVGLFAYGEINSIRLFNEKSTENWQPSGSGTHSNIHHK